jgi:hypothetical protein
VKPWVSHFATSLAARLFAANPVFGCHDFSGFLANFFKTSGALQ